MYESIIDSDSIFSDMISIDSMGTMDAACSRCSNSYEEKMQNDNKEGRVHMKLIILFAESSPNPAGSGSFNRFLNRGSPRKISTNMHS